MDRIELAKRFYRQARMMTFGMAMSVIAYGAIGFFLVRMGKGGPGVLEGGVYALVKYGALSVSIFGVFAMLWISRRMLRILQTCTPAMERHPQRLFVGTIVLSFSAELAVLLGMILVFLGRQPFDYIPFAVIALTGFALAFPQKQKWSDLLGVEL